MKRTPQALLLLGFARSRHVQIELLIALRRLFSLRYNSQATRE